MTTSLGNSSLLTCRHRFASQIPFRSSLQVRSRRRCTVVRAEKVVAVLYKAGKAAENKDLLGCVENELGLRQFLEDKVQRRELRACQASFSTDQSQHADIPATMFLLPLRVTNTSSQMIRRAKTVSLRSILRTPTSSSPPRSTQHT